MVWLLGRRFAARKAPAKFLDRGLFHERCHMAAIMGGMIARTLYRGNRSGVIVGCAGTWMLSEPGSEPTKARQLDWSVPESSRAGTSQ